MVNFNQELSMFDYLAPLVAFVAFFGIVFIMLFTCILWLCVSDVERKDAMKKWDHCKVPAICKHIAKENFRPKNRSTVTSPAH
ncbi:hypothetical protein T01_7017 [Trichinella spiralis]|uniref:Uncharacterized protein n=1 Tax=Trichinella spiralis TaxID=6334 RepID=A0A0V1BBB9_TRISP|nr:hypothetical protein T01_7017 [Trichinella spiralis]